MSHPSFPVLDQKPQGTWETIFGLVVGIGVVVLVAIGGITPPPSPPRSR